MSYLKHKLKSLLSLEDSPEKIAFSFAVGLFITFTPFYGLHTILGILAFTLFRLNKFAVLIGSVINLPWIAPGAYFLSYYVGAKIWSVLPFLRDFELFTWTQFSVFFSSWSQFKYLFEPIHISRIFLPTLLGSTLLGLILAFWNYFLLKKLITRRRMIQTQGQVITGEK